MSNHEQKPIVGIGSELPIGKVVAIKNGYVIVERESNLIEVDFYTIERLV